MQRFSTSVTNFLRLPKNERPCVIFKISIGHVYREIILSEMVRYTSNVGLPISNMPLKMCSTFESIRIGVDDRDIFPVREGVYP